MCYLNQVKHCKTRAMLYINYIKQNLISVLCFSTHVKQIANNAMQLLNDVTHKTINVFFFIECKHKALNTMCYLKKVKYCKIRAIIFLNYVKQTPVALCVLQHMLGKT